MKISTYLYLTALTSLLGSTSLSAQQKLIQKNGIIIISRTLQQNGDSLFIDLTINPDSLVLPSGRSLTLTPMIKGEKDSLSLSSILLNGRNRHKVYVRDLALHKITPDDHYAVIKVTGKKSKEIHYRQHIPFHPWMNGASLAIIEDLCGCGGYTDERNVEELFAIAPNTIPAIPLTPATYKPEWMYSYIVPVPEKLKKRTELHNVYLNFPVNKVIIYPDYMNNQTELAKAEEMIQKINSDKNLHIQEVIIRGYASPEGSVASNFRLSEGRAAALKNYLLSGVEGNKLPMRSESGGEDWDSTIKLLEKSNFQGCDALLSAIRTCSRSDAAEQALRSIQGGAPYASMLKEIYPKVRRVLCSVDYTAREFTVDEGRTLIHTHPEQLSEYEISNIAFSYPDNSPEFLEAFQIAESLYPSTETALLNAAVVALVAGDWEKAATNLQKVSNHDAVYLNASGILLMNQGNKEEAKSYFLQAIEKGSDAARHNLSELDKK